MRVSFFLSLPEQIFDEWTVIIIQLKLRITNVILCIKEYAFVKKTPILFSSDVVIEGIERCLQLFLIRNRRLKMCFK